MYCIVLGIDLTKKALWKRFLNEDLKQRFLLNVYINISDLFFASAMHKLRKTLENSILYFAVGLSRVCLPYYA